MNAGCPWASHCNLGPVNPRARSSVVGVADAGTIGGPKANERRLQKFKLGRGFERDSKLSKKEQRRQLFDRTAFAQIHWPRALPKRHSHHVGREAPRRRRPGLVPDARQATKCSLLRRCLGASQCFQQCSGPVGALNRRIMPNVHCLTCVFYRDREQARCRPR